MLHRRSSAENDDRDYGDRGILLAAFSLVISFINIIIAFATERMVAPTCKPASRHQSVPIVHQLGH
jgi:hypothetical protein